MHKRFYCRMENRSANQTSANQRRPCRYINREPIARFPNTAGPTMSNSPRLSALLHSSSLFLPICSAMEKLESARRCQCLAASSPGLRTLMGRWDQDSRRMRTSIAGGLHHSRARGARHGQRGERKPELSGKRQGGTRHQGQRAATVAGERQRGRG